MQDFDRAVDDIVKSDYRTSDVFKKYGITYCCTGQVPLKTVCLEKKIEFELIKGDLDLATVDIRIPNCLPFNEWELDFLIDYIVHIHHNYIYQTILALGSELRSFAFSHNKKYPEMLRIAELFDKLSTLLIVHNQHEDEIIFPYIKQIESVHRRKEEYGNLFVRTLRKSLSIVEKQHIQTQPLLNQIRILTNGFTFSNNACTNYQVLFHKLEEFHDNLQQHRILESNVLFPRAKAIELQLLLK